MHPGARILPRARTPLLRRYRGAGVRISMDGKGCFLDNIFIERPWAISQIRVRLPVRLLRRARCQGRSVDRLLQSPAALFRPWRANACAGISGWPVALLPGLMLEPPVNRLGGVKQKHEAIGWKPRQVFKSPLNLSNEWGVAHYAWNQLNEIVGWRASDDE